MGDSSLGPTRRRYCPTVSYISAFTDVGNDIEIYENVRQRRRVGPGPAEEWPKG